MKQSIFYLMICLAYFNANGNGEKGDHEKNGCLYAKIKADKPGAAMKTMQRELLLNHVGNQSATSEISDIDDSMAAYAYLANYNSSFVLYLRIEIMSQAASQNYGNIYAGDKLLLKLGNDEVISLESGKSEIGNLDGIITSYSVFYPVPADAVTRLKAKELVKIRIQWSKGYMDYQVANKDFFIRQISCVE